MTFSSCTKKFTAIPPILQNAEVVLVRALDLANGRIPRSPVLSKYFAPPISDPPELHHEFGDQQLLCRGFLLPSLSELGPNSKVISAPSARESFINVNSASSISDLIENKDEGSTAVGIYFSPRVDLDLSHPCTTNPEVLLLPKPHWFFTHTEELVPSPKTFLEVVSLCISANSDFLLKR